MPRETRKDDGDLTPAQLRRASCYHQEHGLKVTAFNHRNNMPIVSREDLDSAPWLTLREIAKYTELKQAVLTDLMAKASLRRLSDNGFKWPTWEAIENCVVVQLDVEGKWEQYRWHAPKLLKILHDHAIAFDYDEVLVEILNDAIIDMSPKF